MHSACSTGFHPGNPLRKGQAVLRAQLSVLFPIPAFLCCTEAGQQDKGWGDTEVPPENFLLGWAMMDAVCMRLFSPCGHAQRDEDTGRGVSSDRQKKRRRWTLQEISREETDTGFVLYWEQQNKILQDWACRQGFLLLLTAYSEWSTK